MNRPPLLSVSNLRVSFHTQANAVEAVRGISFTVEPGELFALVGESGSGKSVTALSLLQLLPAQAFCPSGNILFDGAEMRDAKPAMLQGIRGRKAGIVFQEPMSALNPLHTIGRQIAEAVSIHEPGLSRMQLNERVQALLADVGLTSLAARTDAFPHQLSGGERQRVLIAIAIANNPALLIADEPTTALDVSLQVQILALLQKLRRERGMAVLLITHDLKLVRRIADRVAIMRQGEIVEQGETDRIFSAPAHTYTKALLEAEPQGAPPALSQNAAPLLAVKHLSVQVPGRSGGNLFRKAPARTILQPLSFTVQSGETLGVVGESGSGKTTLGLALMRLMNSSGEISLAGERIDGRSMRTLRPLRHRFQMVFQDPYGSLNPRLTAGAVVSEGLVVHQPHLSAREREERLDAILEETGLSPDLKHRYPHEFSGGQRQRLAIARAMILKPQLVVLDEPTSALDRSVAAQVLAMLRMLQEKYGLSYVFISHDLAVIRAMSHQVLVLKAGEVVESGPAQDVLAKPKHDYTKLLAAAALA